MHDDAARFAVTAPGALNIVPLPDLPPIVQDNFNGTPGDDSLVGTSGNDKFDLSQGGHDIADGKAGKDTFVLGHALDALDVITGGLGKDTVKLNGDYSLTLADATLDSIENIKLGAGHDYDLTMADGNLGAGDKVTITASALGLNDTFTFDGSAETSGRFTVVGGGGDDDLTGGEKNDIFDLSRGGTDTAAGGGGNDTFEFGASLTAADRVYGGGTANGFPFGNVIKLDGDYSAGLTLGANTIHNILSIELATGHSYHLTMNDGNAAADSDLFIDGFGLSAPDTLFIDGSDESDAELILDGGAADDTLIGGSSGDTIQINSGGHDDCRGHDGEDNFNVGAALDPLDRLDGGDGFDKVSLFGNYSNLVLQNATLKNIETFEVNDDFDYNITIADGTVAAGEQLNVSATSLGAGHVLAFDGSADKDGTISVTGGDGADTLTGSDFESFLSGAAGNDILSGTHGDTLINGGDGADIVFAKSGKETLDYIDAHESTGAGYDAVANFDFATDKMDFLASVNAVDHTVNGGTLSTGSFDADMEAAITNHKLAANNAVLFKPDAGTLATSTFLIVDGNGQAGYQAGEDFVINLVSAHGTLTADVFV